MDVFVLTWLEDHAPGILCGVFSSVEKAAAHATKLYPEGDITSEFAIERFVLDAPSEDK